MEGLAPKLRELADQLRQQALEDAQKLDALADEAAALRLSESQEPADPRDAWTWRERLWAAPADTRLGISELCDGLGVTKSWVYARTQESAADPIPHAKLGGALVFRAGEIRAWVRDSEDVKVAGRSDATDAEKAGWAA